MVSSISSTESRSSESNSSSESYQSLLQSSLLDADNQGYLEQQYALYLQNPQKISKEWQQYFAALGGDEPANESSEHTSANEQKISPALMSNEMFEHTLKQMYVGDLIHAYRSLGHLISDINPLKEKKHPSASKLDISYHNLSDSDLSIEFSGGNLYGPDLRDLQTIIDDLKRIYCGTIASEYMHITDEQELMWVQAQIESTLYKREIKRDEQNQIIYNVIAAENLEKYLGAKFPGTKRFSLEGCDTLIVALNALVQQGALQGFKEIVIGMAHRGRLNVLVNILGKPPVALFDEFEGKQNPTALESGDVKYHLGFSSNVEIEGNTVHLSLAFNPSHLECVSPVLCGSVCAREQRYGPNGKNLIMPIIIHGDAAFSGQGVVMETFNMSQTRGFGIGGSIHIIVNNQIGFTTSDPIELRSTLYCSDIGKMMDIPIFHVNADDPEAVYIITNIALAYRNTFFKDVIINLVGYRRHGHNEADEPTVTQPLMYDIIKNRPTVAKLYADDLIARKIFTQEEIDGIVTDYRKALDERDKIMVRYLIGKNIADRFMIDWTKYNQSDWRAPVSTKVDIEKLKKLAQSRDTVPKNFTPHPLIKKILTARQQMTAGELPLDWGYAETLAYATLVTEGHQVRLCGQDSGRGTFFHRQVKLYDQKTDEIYVSLEHLEPSQAKFWIVDSLLSEAGVLGFEYGYATTEPRALVIWEAQFGDFFNNAQVFIDQFISSGEQKWGRISGLVMFLPHGYEGQGPEHSSARIERFLQLCAEGNIQVCVPSTPAQIFHLLRRQMLRPLRKPLIVFTPKSLLRHKRAVSILEELADGEFHPVLPNVTRDNTSKIIKRIIVCAGKVYYDLLAEREKQNRDDVAILRVEQLYPFPEEELTSELIAYAQAEIVVWCQEEPQNQGAWHNIRHHLQNCLLKSHKLLYAGREASAAPAVGYVKKHLEQQQQLVEDAFSCN